MIDLNTLSLALLSVLLAVILILSYLDFRHKRVLNGSPQLSFLVPCYNDGDTVEETLESLHASYERGRFEIIVVNDASTDGSWEKLQALQKKYAFTLVSNEKNLGKAKSLNKIAKLAVHDVLFFVDSDVIMSVPVITDILARMQDAGVQAASAPYKPRNRGFLPLMQAIEYNMLSFLQGAHNVFSTVSLWGGCFAVKKDAFWKVGGLSENAIVEDMDLALKMREAGYKVEQSFVQVRTYVPETLRTWFKQKIRWSSGGAQNLIKHFGVWVRSPLHVFFVVLFSLLSFLFGVSVWRQASIIENIFDNFSLFKETTALLLSLKLIGIAYGVRLLRNFLVSVYFAVFSVPYVVPMIKHWRELWRLIFVIPFSLLYMPVFTVISVIGFVVCLVRYRSLERGARAW